MSCRLYMYFPVHLYICILHICSTKVITFFPSSFISWNNWACCTRWCCSIWSRSPVLLWSWAVQWSGCYWSCHGVATGGAWSCEVNIHLLCRQFGCHSSNSIHNKPEQGYLHLDESKPMAGKHLVIFPKNTWIHLLKKWGYAQVILKRDGNDFLSWLSKKIC